MVHQPSILAPVPPTAAFLFFDLRPGRTAEDLLDELREAPWSDHVVVGLGPRLLSSVGASVPGLRGFPTLGDSTIALPSTPHDLFVRVTGADRGEVLHRERAFVSSLTAAERVDRVDGFMYLDSRDLSGYEDGTENPTGDDAARFALQLGAPGLRGSSILAIQRWVHDLDHLESLSPQDRDHIIGRDRHTNEELEDAPESAHVKRTAQEDFEPEAFVVRRSMPWTDARGDGLVFLCFASSLDPFEAQLRRMVGLDDGIVDGLFRFTRPVTGSTFWCPPLHDGHLDLRAIR